MILRGVQMLDNVVITILTSLTFSNCDKQSELLDSNNLNKSAVITTDR